MKAVDEPTKYGVKYKVDENQKTYRSYVKKMSLKEFKDNQELISAYNNYTSILKDYQDIEQKQVDELDQVKKTQNDRFLTLKENLKNAIEVLMTNPHYLDVASGVEKTEIQTLLDTLR